MIRSVRIALALALPLAGLCAGAAAGAERAGRRCAPASPSPATSCGSAISSRMPGPVADVPIFRAPDLGTRGAVPTERVVEAIRPHQLIGIDTRGLAEVIVTRASRAITPQEISVRVAQALEGQYGLGDARNILVQFDRDVRTLNVEPNVDRRIAGGFARLRSAHRRAST